MPTDPQIAALREALREIHSLAVEERSSATLIYIAHVVEESGALAAAPAVKRDVPCKTPGCNYAMVPLEEDGWYVCTKCRAVHQVQSAAKREVGE